MEINNLEMISFRNHRKTNIDFDPGLTIIWGENGSGKTSILEAIHSLSYGKSFRTNNKKDLIKKGSDFFFIKGRFKNTENFNNTVSLSQDIKGNKKIQINNKVIKKRKDLFGLNNVVEQLSTKVTDQENLLIQLRGKNKQPKNITVDSEGF